MKMKKKKAQQQSAEGIGLVELIVAVGVSSVLVIGVMALIATAIRFNIIGEHKLQGVAFAQEAMEAAQNVRDSDWTNISGLATGAGNPYHSEIVAGNWQLLAGADDPDGSGVFARTLVFDQVWRDDLSGDIVPVGTPGASIDTETRQVTAEVSWMEESGPKEVVQVSYLSDWQVCIDRLKYTFGGEYSFDQNKIEVLGGQAGLIDRSAQEINNGDFETGDLSNWTVESGTVWQASNTFPGHGTWDASTESDSAALGVTRSEAFVSAGQEMKFMIRGFGSGTGSKVTLHRASTNEQLLEQLAIDAAPWGQITWDLSPWPQQNLYIRVTDNSVEPVDGWLAVDYFRQTDSAGNPIEGYATDSPSIVNNTAIDISGVTGWYGFRETATKDGGEIYYQLSPDDGTTWYYWDGGAWAVAGSGDYSSAADVNENIETFSLGSNLKVGAFLISDGTQFTRLDDIMVMSLDGCD